MDEAEWQILFDRVRSGDKEAFSELYRELKQPVYTICRRILQSGDAAEDVTHDVFVKLYASPPDASVKNIRAWIFRMARNQAIDTLRKYKHEDEGAAPETAADVYPALELRLDLESAMQRLPQLQRDILTLHLNAQLSFRETAGIVGLSVPATYRNYRKALITLRDALNGGAL